MGTWPTSEAIRIVKNSLRDLIRNSAFRHDEYFRQQSYTRWALQEILRRLETDRVTPPLIVIEEFADEMDRYSCCNPYTSYIFSVAKDTAQWIIDKLIK